MFLNFHYWCFKSTGPHFLSVVFNAFLRNLSPAETLHRVFTVCEGVLVV